MLLVAFTPCTLVDTIFSDVSDERSFTVKVTCNICYNCGVTDFNALTYTARTHCLIVGCVYETAETFPVPYTGCFRRNFPYFEKTFVELIYTDINKNTYIRIGTVTEILAR